MIGVANGLAEGQPLIDPDALLDAFRDYARALLQPYDVGTVLYHLTDQVVAVLGVDGAGVSLAREGDDLTFVTATDAKVTAIEEQQMAQGAGPCHDAFHTGEVVTVHDLEAEERWPDYCEAALLHGARAVLGIPMPVGEQRIGALSVYHHSPREWPEEQVDVAQVLADMASGYILNASTLAESRGLADQLQHALDSRVIIEQAKGVIAERRDVLPGEAFELIRTHARRTCTRVHDTAQQVVDGVLDL